MKIIQKTRIFYFSGTGNAKRIAQWFSEFAVKKEIDCEIYDIVKYDFNKNVECFNNATIIIISPIHGFNFPKITLNFISRFPRGNNNVVLMNTRAGMKIGSYVTPGITGIAFILSSLILKMKGYKIVGQIPFDMPSNWLSIHPALNEETMKFLYRINYGRVEKHSNKIFSGQRDFLSYRDLIQDVLTSPIALGYFLIGRFVFAKSFYASVNCDSCKACIKQCPVQAIKMVNNHPFWTSKCESCMHCMNICHKRAIETAHGLIIIVSIFSSIALTILFYNILQMELKFTLVILTIWSGTFMLLIFILYYLQHFLVKNRILSKFISLTSLTHYKFWGRYKSIKDNEWKE